MNAAALINRLASFAETLPAAVLWISEEDARWKPPSGAWSILEIVCHLVDEEVEDFRQRLRLTLENPSQPWPPLNPEEAARERKYIERKLSEQVHQFVNERRASIAWLRTLKAPDWNRSYEHPKWGPISAGQLLTSWAAHDMLHLRQLAKRQHELISVEGNPFTSDYAGAWGP